LISKAGRQVKARSERLGERRAFFSITQAKPNALTA
jgi:hypothetical protein